MHITRISVFPVKSMAPNDLTRCDVAPRGLSQDRRWMVVDAQDRFITGRRLPELVLCSPSMRGDTLTLVTATSSISVARPNSDALVRQVVVWKDSVPSLDAGDAVADWLSRQFGVQLRLVYQADEQHRWLPEAKAFASHDEVSFADGYPLLIIGSESLNELNARLATPVTMDHFRPNIVVETTQAFVEDRWQSIRVGDAVFDIATPCSRCVFTTVDPQNGERRTDGEPLKTLGSYRRDPVSRQIMFGVNAIPRSIGNICVSDPVVAAVRT